MPTNYCGNPPNVVDPIIVIQSGHSTPLIQQHWKDFVDAMMERWTGMGYKGATRVMETWAFGATTLPLPGKAKTVTAVYEGDRLMAADEYELSQNGQKLRRKQGFLSPARFLRGTLYKVTYVEPPITDLPPEWTTIAIQCVAIMQLWAIKQKEDGLALSVSGAADAGEVSRSGATTYPGNLVDEIQRHIKKGLPRPTRF